MYSLTPIQDDNQFRKMFARAPLGLVLTGVDGVLIEANDAYAHLTGYSREELPSINFISLTHPDEIGNNRRLFEDLISQKIDGYALEKRIVQKSGAIRWVRSHASLILDSEGKAVTVIGQVEDITERKTAEARYHSLADSIPQMVWTAGPNGLLDYVNKPGCDYLGLPEAELLGAGWLQGVHPDDQPSAVERWTNSLQTGQVYETSFRLKRGSDETWRLYLVRANPLKNGGGEVTQWLGTCTDIEDQNRVTQQIEEDRGRWRDLLVQTPAAIAVLRGRDHRFEWVNPDYARLVGRPIEAIAGKTVLEALPEIEAQVYIGILNRVFDTGEPFRAHESLARLDRGNGLEDVYINFVYLPTRDTSGAVDGIFVHVTDMTEAVIARKELEDREQQFRTLAETIPHLAWMADGTGDIFWYNRRWFDYTGTKLGEMSGWGWQKVHDPRVLPEVMERWQRAIELAETFEMIFPLRGADGEFHPFLTRVEPVRNNAGEVVRWFGTNTDITEQLRTEGELRRMNRELEEFSYVASHDLQEPLRMVNIYSQLLLKSVDSDDEQIRKYSGFVRDGVKRMEGLIHDLLTFSRSVRTEEIEVGVADLAVSLHDALEVLDVRIIETGAKINAMALPQVRGDTPQMSHVFQNIISNALKYRKSDIAPEISISAALEGNEWIIAIRDNGIGFEPQYAERIFGLFKRLHTKEYPGTGLGLAICKRVVERYGGRIWAESIKGEGSTFYFSLIGAAYNAASR